jgi:ADP-ribosylglycohydrolase
MKYIRDRFSGCIIGQCLGDALGFPLEGHPSTECKRYVEGILKRGRAGEISRPPYPFGQYTDDSQLARELLLSYVSCGGFNPEDYAGRIAVIFKDGLIVGRGRATEEAALRLINGTPWYKAGTPPPSAGNGSAMRAAPIGLIFHDNPEALISAAHDQGRITHQDRRCSAGAVAIAGSVALAIREDRIDTHRFITCLSEWVGLIDRGFASHILRLEEWLRLTPDDAVRSISAAGIINNKQYVRWDGISPFVICSVLWSVYSFLRSPDDYWETICTAIYPGGDVDTTAAMAGAISGAYNGIQAIPEHLAHRLTDNGRWGFEELLNLARRAYEVKMHQEGKRRS